jgi:hypothetical protein
MSRDVDYDPDGLCEMCGRRGVFDLFGSGLCAECLAASDGERTTPPPPPRRVPETEALWRCLYGMMTPFQRALVLALATAADSATDIDTLARQRGMTVSHAVHSLRGLQTAGLVGGDAGMGLRLLLIPPPTLIADWEGEGLTIER